MQHLSDIAETTPAGRPVRKRDVRNVCTANDSNRKAADSAEAMRKEREGDGFHGLATLIPMLLSWQQQAECSTTLTNAGVRTVCVGSLHQI
ncbi:hypothetical protein RRG08_022642 [Elysia crispata]|uniref:Uncharacterized protein n=1 Tax=Elysia crispata TaxID=231223 RepID=A0AAE0Z1W8_9GAST|nr:hypothetical protein RRG08_022642 [Elysia crispata]